jgi:hypothetical protein
MSKSRAQTQPQRSIARSAAQGPSRSLSLADIEPQETRQVRIGTSGWHYKSWHGPFYPSTLRIKDFLSFYVGEFDTAEINNSFYRLPTEQAVRAWRDGAPEGFLFAWKVSRFITHMKRLKDIEDSIDLVFGRMAGLGEKFGPVLFQLPPTCCGTTTRRFAFPTMRMRPRLFWRPPTSCTSARMAPTGAMPEATAATPFRVGLARSPAGPRRSGMLTCTSTTTSKAPHRAMRASCSG